MYWLLGKPYSKVRTYKRKLSVKLRLFTNNYRIESKEYMAILGMHKENSGLIANSLGKNMILQK